MIIKTKQERLYSGSGGAPLLEGGLTISLRIGAG